MKSNLRKILFLFICSGTSFLYAQKILTGTVVDPNNLPLIGVTLIEEGTNNGTVTDFDGNFEMKVNDGNSKIIISYLGFETKTLSANDPQGFTKIVLVESTESLDEVVVVGYGKMKKSDLTGSVGSIDSKQLERNPRVNVADALQGQVAGLSIRATSNNAEGTGTNILIRGQNSISASNSPLIVLDGIPFAGNMSEINPVDVNSIEVLKDASSTAIYGSRGANGVIPISTKRGVVGKPILTFDTYYRFDQVGHYPKMMNGRKFGDAKVTYGEPLTNIEQRNYDSGQSTNWMDLVTQSGHW